MTRYKNLESDSGIIAYETASDSISVVFKDRSLYMYTYRSAGQANIQRMKALAATGRGLNTFISQNVKKAYASKGKVQSGLTFSY